MRTFSFRHWICLPLLAAAVLPSWGADYTPPPLPPAVNFPSAKIINITDRGAKTDGYTYCSDIISKAIDECAAAGGGIVQFPKGEYLTGPIRLKSNITLQVDEGATIYFSNDRSVYPIVKTRYEGTDIMNFSPLIYAYQCENIRITGKGKLDGQGADWWAWAVPPRGRGGPRGGGGAPRPEADAPEGDPATAGLTAEAAPPATAPTALTAATTGPATTRGGRGQAALSPGRRLLLSYINDRDGKIPVEQRIFGDKDATVRLRPCFIEPYECKNILVEGVTVTQSPFWTIHPLYSENVTIRNVNVIGNGANTDGCDPDSCKTVLIEGCTFTTGDDCIAIKSGKDGDGIHRNATCENITIRNCTMIGGHGAITMGSETSAGIKHVFAENNIVKGEGNIVGPDSTVRLKTSRTRGGGIEDVYVRNMKTTANRRVAITIDMLYGYDARRMGPPKDAPVTESTPVIRNIRIENFTSDASPQAIMVRGLKESQVENLVLKNVTIKAEQGASLEFIKGLQRENVDVTPKTGEAWTLKEVAEAQ